MTAQQIATEPKSEPKSEPKTEPKFNDFLGIPVHSSLKIEIKSLAKAEERDMTSMARMLLKEAIAARQGTGSTGSTGILPVSDGTIL